jgi:hypothetical protein
MAMLQPRYVTTGFAIGTIGVTGLFLYGKAAAFEAAPPAPPFSAQIANIWNVRLSGTLLIVIVTRLTRSILD